MGSDASFQEKPAEAPQTAGEAAFDESTGGIEGTVYNSEALPVADAQLSLQPGDRATSTAQDGSFSFSSVPPGKYTLFVAKLGYEAAARAVTVNARDTVAVRFQLAEIPVKEPRIEILGPFKGYMTCRMGTPVSSGFCGFPIVPNSVSEQIWTNDKLYFLFRLTGEDWQNVVFEARWKPSTIATNPNMMQVFSYTNRTSTHWFADSGAKPSPINFVYVHGERGPGGQLPSGQPTEPNLNLTLRAWLTTPFGSTTRPVEVAYDLRFDMMVSIFYSSDAPGGFTALPDS